MGRTEERGGLEVQRNKEGRRGVGEARKMAGPDRWIRHGYRRRKIKKPFQRRDGRRRRGRKVVDWGVDVGNGGHADLEPTRDGGYGLQ